MSSKIPDAELQAIRALVARVTGLDFPLARWADLRRGIVAAAKGMGFHTRAEFTLRLLGGMPAEKELEALINHLTVGETYFFREKRTFEILAEQILPLLIRARRVGDRRLRIWSAACCTGEEPYSIAILLSRLIPDLADWDITLLATDINSRFLLKANAGEFGKWSFRDAPNWLAPDYFEATGNGCFRILPEIKRLVRFVRLNLAGGDASFEENNIRGMDVIFCRNVLMYFTPEQARNVIRQLHRAQADGGWLIVGPAELVNVGEMPYVACPGHSSMVYRKQGEEDPAPIPAPITVDFSPAVELSTPKLVVLPSRQAAKPGDLAISLANEGKLSEALVCCNEWISAEKLNARSHYLRAVILQEQGKTDEAVQSLRTALYLDPALIPAHFALGNIARKRGKFAQAARHLKNARELACKLGSDDALPEFEGVTASRFVQIIDSLLENEVGV